MKVIHTIKDLQAELTALRAQGKKVGLVPTMGALHAGHASLVKRSVSENGVTVVSVFVNPTQFNDKNDLAKYPRTLDADCRLLEDCGAAFAFAPSVEEMYPQPDTREFSYAPLDTVMEGAFRPGHFQRSFARLSASCLTRCNRIVLISERKISSNWRLFGRWFVRWIINWKL